MEESLSSKKNLLNSGLLSRVSSLHILVEQLLWGYRTGAFRSIRKDSGIEFLEHKDYTIGEDIRDVDWKVSARREKLLVRKYQAESDLTAIIALDISADMSIGSPPPIETSWLYQDKFTRGLVLAATMAKYLQIKGERVGLILMGEQSRQEVDEESEPHIFTPSVWLPPKSSNRHFIEIMTKLAECQPQGEAQIGKHLEYLAQHTPNRSILFVISDLMEETDTWSHAIPWFQSKKIDLRLVHMYAHREFTMQVKKPLKFLSYEDTFPLPLDPEEIREPFLEIVQSYLQEIQDLVGASKVTYIPDALETPIENAFLSLVLNRHVNPIDILTSPIQKQTTGGT
jgi:hypothetical protein